MPLAWLLESWPHGPQRHPFPVDTRADGRGRVCPREDNRESGTQEHALGDRGFRRVCRGTGSCLGGTQMLWLEIGKVGSGIFKLVLLTVRSGFCCTYYSFDQYQSTSFHGMRELTAWFTSRCLRSSVLSREWRTDENLPEVPTGDRAGHFTRYHLSTSQSLWSLAVLVERPDKQHRYQTNTILTF